MSCFGFYQYMIYNDYNVLFQQREYFAHLCTLHTRLNSLKANYSHQLPLHNKNERSKTDFHYSSLM